MANIAITPARSTDGSKRVSAMNQPIRARVAAHLHHGRNRRSSGDAAAMTNATFSPETAVRCDSPDARKALTMPALWRVSSPITSPVNRLASASPIAAFRQIAVRRPHPRRRAIQRRTLVPIADDLQVEAADHVTELSSANVRCVRAAIALHVHELTGLAFEQPPARRPVGPRVEALALDLDRDTEPSVERRRVADDWNPARVVTEMTRRSAVPIDPRPPNTGEAHDEAHHQKRRLPAGEQSERRQRRRATPVISTTPP